MSEFYWCIEYLATFIEIFLCCYFCGTFVVKEKIEDVRNRIIVLTIMASVMIILLNKLELFSYMTTLIFILLCVLMQCILYRKRYLHLVTLVLVYAAILSAIDFLVLYFVTINMNSDSDGDDYDDFEEVEQKSDPLNYSVDSRAINFFTNSYNFYYEDIAELIDDGALRAYNEYAAIIYGVWDKEELYRDLIIDYYTNYATQDMMESEELEEQKKIWTDTLYTFLDNASDVSQDVTNGYSYVTSIYGLIDYVKGAQSLDELQEAFRSRVTLLIIEMNKISEDATLMRFEVNGLEYQKHLLDFDKVKSAVTCSDKVMEKICTGVAFTSYGLDILDTVVEVSKVRANNKVFATNMDALIRISIQSKDENISNAAFQIEQELAANYLGAISVFGNDIIENAVKEVVRYASTKNIYVFAVVATRDLIDLAFGVSNDIKQEYKILCYSEISKAYVDLISDMGMVSKNNNYYNVPEYSVIRFKRYMVNIEQLRVIGEIEYYNFYKCEGIFSKLGDWVYDTKSVKDLINAQLSNIKDWVDLLPLVLSEKIKYKI